jgi:hypothetical protein
VKAVQAVDRGKKGEEREEPVGEMEADGTGVRPEVEAERRAGEGGRLVRAAVVPVEVEPVVNQPPAFGVVVPVSGCSQESAAAVGEVKFDGAVLGGELKKK